MNNLAALAGTLRYEFWMQARRKALWIGFALLSLFVFRNFGDIYLGGNAHINGESLSITYWASFLALFFPIGAGLLLADRFSRDRKTRVDELLWTAPASTLARLLGKYLGSVLATLLPIFVIYLVGIALILTHWHDFSALPLVLAAFAAANVPGILFVGAFSIACTTVLWPVLYQFLFVGYWFWGNLLNPKVGIPTLNGTLLMPSDRYIIGGFLPSSSAFVPSTTALQGIESLALLLGCAAIALLAAWQWLRWQADHR